MKPRSSTYSNRYTPRIGNNRKHTSAASRRVRRKAQARARQK